jgi:O-antigen biosynthesis protein
MTDKTLSVTICPRSGIWPQPSLTHAQTQAGHCDSWRIQWCASRAELPEHGNVLLVDSDLRWPIRWLERLLSRVSLFPNHFHTCFSHALAPVRIGTTLSGSAALIDALCAALGNGDAFEVQAFDSPVHFLPAQARTQAPDTLILHAGLFFANSEQIQIPGPRGNAQHPDQNVLLEEPWYALADQIQQRLHPPQQSNGSAKVQRELDWLMDTRPRLLHVLHSWGGGVEQFAVDFARGDKRFRHLFLIADAEHASQQLGCQLRVVDANSGLVLQQQLLSPKITTLSNTHSGYRDFFASILNRFTIESVLISSLIGHSLDALRSELPTALMLHDYFPLWPDLHANFCAPERRFDAEEFAIAATRPSPFQSQSVQQWKMLRDRYVELLCERKLMLFAPSRLVLDISFKMAPELKALSARVIAHGFEPFTKLALQPSPKIGAIGHRTKLRVLVPGRINSGKGELLLAQLLPQASDFAEFVLLGAGKSGLNFLGKSGVDVIFDYARNDLPDWIDRIEPDLALLPRTVSETFSFSLSELFALGVPTLATRTGALAERIQHAENGFLCDATANALLSALKDLHRDPELLNTVRNTLKRVELPSIATQANLLSEKLSLSPSLFTQRNLDLPSAQNTQIALLRSAIAHADSERTQWQQNMTQLQSELAVRGDWGHRVQKLLDERTKWAQSLNTTVSELQTHLQSRETQFADEISIYRTEIARLQDFAVTLNTEIERLGQEAHLHHQQHRQSQAELQASNERIQEFIQSRSWRITKPLRFAQRSFSRMTLSLKFRLQRLVSLARRAVSSVRTRGLSATVQRALKRSDAPMPTMPLSLPEKPDVFTGFEVTGTATNDQQSIDVSIVIPVYNKFDYTETCLRALAAAPSKLNVEVIVVDDCSSDETWGNLQQISGIHAHKNAQNLGFIGACNAGAAIARGEYVLFLNNDTAVQAEWLDCLIETLRTAPLAGMVGSMLIYPDGRLQESGGIIFNDGSGWNYGRFDDPQDPHYNYVREVDYCSGAAIALKRSLFNEFGGFDTLYTPAYYEDTDLAFKVRQAGLRVYVQPQSKVVHFEGISSGTDLTSGIKRYQVVNQQKFLARWATVLATHPPAPPHQAIGISCEHRARRQVLVVDAVTPMPDQDSGSLRMVNLLSILRSEGCAVTFFCDGLHYHKGYAEALQQMGVQVLYAPFIKSEPAWLAAHGAKFDVVLLSRHYVAAPLLPLIRAHCRKAKIVFDTVDLHFLREEREAELRQDRTHSAMAAKTKQQELAIMQASDLTLVVSPIEQNLLASMVPQVKVDILSNIHDVPGRAAAIDERADLLFVGGFQHPPNVDAALWFVQEILPLVHARLPQIKLHLVGSNTPASINALASDHVIVHGFVPDIDPMLAKARLSIAPLRYGAGVKGKVNMAMAHGLPVIATPAAVEGMHCKDRHDVMIGESAQAFADALVEAYQDASLWLQISDGGLENVRTHFSFEAARSQIRKIFALS